jgi:DUF1009 family protein
LPTIVAAAAVRAGRPVLIVAIRGEADPSIAAYPHRLVGWGEVGRLLVTLKSYGARELVLVGRIGMRPDYSQIPVDRAGRLARASITRILQGGDNSVLSGALELFESRGFRIRGAHEIARELVVPSGLLTRTQSITEIHHDGELAFTAAKEIGSLDAGQAAVVVDGRVVALEGAEGTDAMLERVAMLRRNGKFGTTERSGVLAKCAKPHQDLRVDMPTIGPETVKAAAAAGLTGIVIEAGQVIVAEREATIRKADALGLSMRAKMESERNA